MTAATLSAGRAEPRAPFRRLPALARRWFPDVFAALAFLVPLGCFVCWLAFFSPTAYYVRLLVESDRAAWVQVFFDAGPGFVEEKSVRVAIEPGGGVQDLRFPINVDRIKALRLDPADGPVALHVHGLTIRKKTKHWFRSQPVYAFDLKTLRAGQQIASLTPDGQGGVRIVSEEEGDDPYCTIEPAKPLTLGANWLSLAVWSALATVVWLAVWAAMTETVRRLPPRAAWGAARFLAACVAFWRRRSPAQAIWLVAGASVVLSCYPVIFCGKSFCSPNFAEGTFQLYGRFPTLPGTNDTATANGRGADLGSMAWAHGPYAVVESRALFRDHELPLWNRYNYSGVPLLGQGQVMFGDPLQCLVLAAGGRAWAWDAKFVLAKLLFAAGVGFLVWIAAESLPAALLLCFSSAFIGFFSYRLNHPGYFSLCYAPWILVAWLKIVRAPDWRLAMRWAGGLILANWTVMNSGTAKEAYMDLGCLNLCGCLLLLFYPRAHRARLHRLLGLAVAGGIFCLLAAPILAAFFDTLKVSISNYDERHAWQLQPGMLIGLFDDIFYRQLNLNEDHLDPSANFLVLLGTLLALSHFKRLVANRVFLAVALSALLSAALVFGVVPPSFIRAFPILGNVVHVDNTFSCVLFVHLFVLAGFGLKMCLARAGRRDWPRDVLVAFLLGGAILALYFGFVQAAQHTTAVAFLQIDQEVARSPFFYAYALTLVAALLLLPFVLRRLRLEGARPATLALFVLCLWLMHWRAGLQLAGPFAPYTPVLPDRIDLLAKSDTVDFLHADSPDAFRVLGLNSNLMLGYSGVVDLENIVGPDALINPYYRELENTGMQAVDGWFSREVNQELLTRVKPFFDLLNVRYYLSTPGESLADVPGLTLARQADLDVYHSDGAWPRAFFVNRVDHYKGAEDFSAKVVAGDGLPFAAVEENELPGLPELADRFPTDPAGRTVVPATDYHLTGNTTSFDLEAPEPGIIVLTEAYVPRDFTALLNGQKARVFRVNHAFKGLVVDRPGSYHVSFAYCPRFFIPALYGAGVGLLLLAAAGWWLFRRAPPAAPWMSAREDTLSQPHAPSHRG